MDIMGCFATQQFFLFRQRFSFFPRKKKAVLVNLLLISI